MIPLVTDVVENTWLFRIGGTNYAIPAWSIAARYNGRRYEVNPQDVIDFPLRAIHGRDRALKH